MEKKSILSQVYFGQRTAEQESEQLFAYFVQTDQWKSIVSGKVDIVYGSKGAGKSAIYWLILSGNSGLGDRGIVTIPAENPRGDLAFADLAKDAPTDEHEFRALWKLYFLCLMGRQLRSSANSSAPAQEVVRRLEEAQLLPPEQSLVGILRSALRHIRQIMKFESISGGVEMDPATGLPSGLIGKITLREPEADAKKLGLVSVNDLIKQADAGFKMKGTQLWILLDRLDVAFATSDEKLETDALRALFRVYLDFGALQNVALKLFLRTDLWNRITSQGFREASHIVRDTTISWNRAMLVNLIARRLLHNPVIAETFGLNPAEVLADSKKQVALVRRILPSKMDAVPDDTLEWVMSRLEDGSHRITPRELIHLLTCSRDMQVQRFELGAHEPDGEALFDSRVLKRAMREVSIVRFEKTLCAEYKVWKNRMTVLRGERSQLSIRELAKIWNETDERAMSIAENLAEIGFFERPENSRDAVFTIPFLYRPALNIKTIRPNKA